MDINELQKLNKIYNYKTDKLGAPSSLFLGTDYSDAYIHHFLPLKNKIKVFFEIGVAYGGSLEMWSDFFSDSLIVGMDIKSGYIPTRKNSVIEIGDATNPNFIKQMISKYGNPDITLDDGSHLSSQMKKSFEIIYPYTNMIYCIEDLGTQYNSFSEGRFIDDGISMMNDLFKLIHKNNEYPHNDYDYKQLCFSKYQCYIYKKWIL